MSSPSGRRQPRVGAVDNQARQLFVVGASRTGTSALCRYLSLHPEICVLNERYKKIARDVGPGHFRFARVRENMEAETNLPPGRTEVRFEALLDTKQEHRLKWFGDKGYGYASHMERVNDNNPGCAFFMTLRDPVPVAASYLARKHNPRPGDTWMEGKDAVREAIRAYNTVLAKAREFIQRRPTVPFVLIEYESFYKEPEGYEPLLSEVLGLDLRKLVEEWREKNEKFAARRKEKPISEKEAARMEAGVDRDALAWIKAYGPEQRTAVEAAESS